MTKTTEELNTKVLAVLMKSDDADDAPSAEEKEKSEVLSRGGGGLKKRSCQKGIPESLSNGGGLRLGIPPPTLFRGHSRPGASLRGPLEVRWRSRVLKAARGAAAAAAAAETGKQEQILFKRLQTLSLCSSNGLGIETVKYLTTNVERRLEQKSCLKLYGAHKMFKMKATCCHN
ncbi:hypothetical protein INR49_004242 [Caranx melampygus]|nr:hypothetical protein INR49_004242 [Caranx melampygus]